MSSPCSSQRRTVIPVGTVIEEVRGSVVSTSTAQIDAIIKTNRVGW